MFTPVSDEVVRLVEPGHQYLVGEGLTERVRPSLSALLAESGFTKDYSLIDPDLLAFRARVGTLTHRLIEEYLNAMPSAHAAYAMLDAESDKFLALHTKPHLDAFLEWANRHALEAAFFEVPAYNPDWEYCCTADFVGYLDRIPYVIDWKTTSRISKTVALQTMGQRLCFKLPGDSTPVEPKRAALHLPKKGPAKLVPFRDNVNDYTTLQAIATCHRQRRVYL